MAVISGGSIDRIERKAAEYGLESVIPKEDEGLLDAYRVRGFPALVEVAVDGSVARPPALGADPVRSAVQRIADRSGESGEALGPMSPKKKAANPVATAIDPYRERFAEDASDPPWRRGLAKVKPRQHLIQRDIAPGCGGPPRLGRLATRCPARLAPGPGPRFRRPRPGPGDQRVKALIAAIDLQRQGLSLVDPAAAAYAARRARKALVSRTASKHGSIASSREVGDKTRGLGGSTGWPSGPSAARAYFHRRYPPRLQSVDGGSTRRTALRRAAGTAGALALTGPFSLTDPSLAGASSQLSRLYLGKLQKRLRRLPEMRENSPGRTRRSPLNCCGSTKADRLPNTRRKPKRRSRPSNAGAIRRSRTSSSATPSSTSNGPKASSIARPSTSPSRRHPREPKEAK